MRSTAPDDRIDLHGIGCTGRCEQGEYDCDCNARPVSAWRDMWDAELRHPWLLAVYALALVIAIAASAAWPLPWWGVQ